MLMDKAARTDAFEAHIRPHLKSLKGYAINNFNISAWDADDLIQETAIKAYSALDRFDGRYPFAWLSVIMRNTYVSQLRKRNGRRKAKPKLVFAGDASVFDQITRNAEPSAEDKAVEAIYARYEIEALREAVQGLPKNSRSTFQLLLGGYSQKEAAEKLGVSYITVRTRRHKGIKLLQEALA